MKTFVEFYDKNNLVKTLEPTSVLEAASVLEDLVALGVCGRNTAKVLFVSIDAFGSRRALNLTQELWGIIA